MARINSAKEGLEIIEKAIEEVRRQGLGVGYRDGKLCVENTIGCHHSLDYNNPFNISILEERNLDEDRPKIDKDSHYFIRMRPLHVIPYIGWGMRCSTDKEKWVECIIQPEDFGKVRAIALDETYGSEKFYVDDFEQLLQRGEIIRKTSPKQEVKKIVWFEPIPNTMALYRNEAWVVTDESGNFEGAMV